MNQLLPRRMYLRQGICLLLALAYAPDQVSASRRRKKYPKPSKTWYIPLVVIGSLFGVCFILMAFGCLAKWFQRRDARQRGRDADAEAILERDREDVRIASEAEMQSLRQAYARDEEQEDPPAPPYTPAPSNGDTTAGPKAKSIKGPNDVDEDLGGGGSRTKLDSENGILPPLPVYDPDERIDSERPVRS